MQSHYSYQTTKHNMNMIEIVVWKI